ncbi:MAG TPA: hypothetical protein VIO11_02045 [Candidatus Methanoperedens sp.]
MQPYVLRHKGNFSAAVRDIIDHVGKSVFPSNSAAMESPLFKWVLNELEGVLVPDSVLDEMLDPILINSMRRLEECLNFRFNELEWDISITIKSDKDTLPSDVLAEIRGTAPRIRFVACILSQFLVKNSLEREPLEICSVVNLNECIKIEFSRSNKKEAQDSLITYFGGMNEAMNVIQSRPAFWKAVIKRHLLSNYNMVTVHRNYFEDLLSNNIPLGEITIENLAKRPIEEIPLKEMLLLIKEVYETSRVVDRVEIENENIILFHSYRAREAAEKIKKILVTLLEANGHLYDAKSTANMIVLTNRPDVSVKVDEIVDNLKTSSSNMDQELVMFMTFLRGLKDIPDIPLSMTALGRKIGKSLMQEYEKEKGIKSWNLNNFKDAFEIINSRLHIECDWKLEGKNLLYTVKKCNIATEGNKFDTYICHTARETFKGALTHAFGNGAELEIKKLLTHGDKFCEVVIRIP